jgi:hypothetical protein
MGRESGYRHYRGSSKSQYLVKEETNSTKKGEGGEEEG